MAHRSILQVLNLDRDAEARLLFGFACASVGFLLGIFLTTWCFLGNEVIPFRQRPHADAIGRMPVSRFPAPCFPLLSFPHIPWPRK